jgi:hypothetical protein
MNVQIANRRSEIGKNSTRSKLFLNQNTNPETKAVLQNRPRRYAEGTESSDAELYLPFQFGMRLLRKASIHSRKSSLK